MNYKRTYTNTYDASGNETERIEYDEKGEIVGIDDYKYDTNGKMIKDGKTNPGKTKKKTTK